MTAKMSFSRMSSATHNIFHQAREKDGRSISSVRKFARSIHQAAVRVQRTRSRAEFIDQIVTWFGECADGYIAPQLEDQVTQSNHADFTIAVVTAGLLLISDSVDLVNRVACFIFYKKSSIKLPKKAEKTSTNTHVVL